MIRLTVLLLFGGESSEHDVSIMSARNVYAAMDGEKYDINFVISIEWVNGGSLMSGKKI